jgi:hypothetical protein
MLLKKLRIQPRSVARESWISSKGVAKKVLDTRNCRSRGCGYQGTTVRKVLNSLRSCCQKSCGYNQDVAREVVGTLGNFC